MAARESSWWGRPFKPPLTVLKRDGRQRPTEPPPVRIPGVKPALTGPGRSITDPLRECNSKLLFDARRGQEYSRPAEVQVKRGKAYGLVHRGLNDGGEGEALPSPRSLNLKPPNVFCTLAPLSVKDN